MDSDIQALASLEERIRRAAELVTSLRSERDAAVAELERVREANAGSAAEADQLKRELEELRAEREQVRVRIEKLLGQMDVLGDS